MSKFCAKQTSTWASMVSMISQVFATMSQSLALALGTRPESAGMMSGRSNFSSTRLNGIRKSMTRWTIASLTSFLTLKSWLRSLKLELRTQKLQQMLLQSSSISATTQTSSRLLSALTASTLGFSPRSTHRSAMQTLGTWNSRSLPTIWHLFVCSSNLMATSFAMDSRPSLQAITGSSIILLRLKSSVSAPRAMKLRSKTWDSMISDTLFATSATLDSFLTSTLKSGSLRICTWRVREMWAHSYAPTTTSWTDLTEYDLRREEEKKVWEKWSIMDRKQKLWY